MVTQEGIEAGETTLSVLCHVLGLTGLSIEGDRVQLPTPPARDRPPRPPAPRPAPPSPTGPTGRPRPRTRPHGRP